jgi:hypothetical protein
MRSGAGKNDPNQENKEEKQMAVNDNDTFVLVKDSEGDKFLCPLNKTNSSNRIDVNDDCIEENVVGRYAGNIKVKT